MQDKNRTFQRPPRAGDGTVPADKLVPEANWFGTSQEPQEEFTEHGAYDKPQTNKPEEKSGPMSEGEPTLGK